MALRDWMKSGSTPPATVATVATDGADRQGTVAEVATVAGGESASHSAAGAESRRMRALALLAASPGRRYAAVTDEEDAEYPGCVVVGVGMRQHDGTLHTADIIIPRDRYDGCDLLEVLVRCPEGSA